MAEDASMIECPGCHQLVNAGKFCEFCGCRLPDVATSPAAEGAGVDHVEAPVAAPCIPAPGELPDEDGASCQPDGPRPASVTVVTPPWGRPPVRETAERALPPRAESRPFAGYGALFADVGGRNAEADDLQIRLKGTLPSEFLEGFVAALSFHVQTTGVDYESVQLSICRDGKVLASAEPVSGVGPDGRGVSLNHAPTQTGRMNVRVRLVCRRSLERDEEVYESDDFSVSVWPKENEAQRQITVNYAPTISNVNVDRAADLKINGFGLNHDGASPVVGETLEQRVRRLAATVAEKTLPLHIVSLPRRLTLWEEDSGKFVHVLTGDKLRFGRHKANDVVLRVFDEDRSLKREDSLAISKIHFTVENDQDVCRVCDGGLVGDGELKDTPGGTRIHASYGTAVSGKKLSRGGSALLEPDRPADLALAPDVGKTVLGLSASVKKCRSCSRRDAKCPAYAVSSLLLTRSDDLEVYLAVWQCADLGDVLPELKGYFIKWDRNRFVLCDPDGVTRTLWPGIQIGNRGEVRVRSFRQNLL